MPAVTPQAPNREELPAPRVVLGKSAAVALFVISLDQWSKEVFFGGPAGGGALNPGVCFCLGSELAGQEMNVALIALAIAIAWWQRAYFLKHPILAGLFFGGVASNILDRVFFGAVRDWLPVPGLELYNNLADWAIFLSWAVFFIIALKKRNSHEQHS
jgi:lipoprotein signal peptidase